MKVKIEKLQNTYSLQIEYNVSARLPEVWNILASNEGFAKWFPELHLECKEDRKLLVFEMEDFREEMQILSYLPLETISYTWDSARVEFRLAEHELGTQIEFREEIPSDFGNEFADAGKDMAGWLVQNECISLLLEGKTVPEIEALQEKWQTFVANQLD